MQQKVIFSPTTAAVTKLVTIAPAEIGSILIADTSLGNKEQIELQQKNSDSSFGLIVLNGEEMVLTGKNTQVKVNSATQIRVSKGVTASPVGMSVLVPEFKQ